MVRKIDKSEWVNVLNVMKRYNREEGYVNDLQDKLTFFDGNACIEGCFSLHVTKEEVEGYIKNYENK